MACTIRQASTADADGLALVGAATFLETFAGILDGGAIIEHCRREHSAEAYRRCLADGGAAWLAEMEPGGAPVGFALAGDTRLPGSDPNGGDLELKRIYLLSRLHGAGVGAELMRRVIAWAAERGGKRLLLGVFAGNAHALAFYRKQGFARIADRRFRVGSHVYDDLVLARELRGPGR